MWNRADDRSVALSGRGKVRQNACCWISGKPDYGFGLCKTGQGSPNDMIPDRQSIVPAESQNQSGGLSCIFLVIYEL